MKGQKEVLGLLHNYMSTGWPRLLTRRNEIRAIRVKIVELLSSLSSYYSLSSAVKETVSSFQEEQYLDKFTMRILENIDWRDSLQIEPIDVDHLTRVLEHVRSESQSYLARSSSFDSAILGGIVGSLLTLLAKFVLGIP
jgi:hypothetical protein